MTTPVEPPLSAVIQMDRPKSKAAPCKRFDKVMKSGLDPQKAPLHILADLAKRIVAVEGPNHLQGLARRVPGAFDKVRTGRRISEATDLALKAARKRDPSPMQAVRFAMTAAQISQTPIPERTTETASLIKTAYVSPSEVKT